MGYKRSAWWRKPANGTQGDTEDKNLVEAYPRAMDLPVVGRFSRNADAQM